MPPGRGPVTRFVVMAILQAARARALGLPTPSAYSWGLNRAIFYAAAKRGFRGAAEVSGSHPEAAPKKEPVREPFRLGDEEAFREPGGLAPWFTIGGKAQTEKDFDHQVGDRFSSKENFRKAWDEATHIVNGYGRETRESRRRFFDEVYKTRRDELSERWSRDLGRPSPQTTAT